VAVLLVPLEENGARGLLCLRRGIEPQRGRLALVGGFLEEHETWQEGGAREVREEVDVAVDPSGVEPFWFTSTAPRPNRVLLFGTAPAVPMGSLGPFAPRTETLERGVLWGPDGLEDVFAFSLHLEAARRWFAREGITGPHRYRTV
jgi:ADP-ribose pyrophosphatase YjhB (NUDIX family)